jgi:hypothetical protein
VTHLLNSIRNQSAKLASNTRWKENLIGFKQGKGNTLYEQIFSSHATTRLHRASSRKNAMKTYPNPCLQLLFWAITLLLSIYSSDAIGQSGLNGGKPIITFNTTGPVSIKTQTPPSFPGGEDKLNAFVLNQVEEAKNPVKLSRKVWLTASLDGTGKIIELVPTYDGDPTLKREIARVGSSMPRWNPGTINGQGVETKYQFLLQR